MEWLDEFVKKNDIDMSNAEKVGSILVIYGLGYYIASNNAEISEYLDIDNWSISAEELIYIGEIYIIVGYLLLLMLSIREYSLKSLEKAIIGDEVDVRPELIVAISYIITFYAGLTLVMGFYQIFINRENNGKLELDNDVKDKLITLANLENIGVAFVILGYYKYIKAANVEIEESLGTYTGLTTSVELFYDGSKYINIGIAIFFFVSSYRLNIRIFLIEQRGYNINIEPFVTVRNGYLLSTYASYLRVVALKKLIEEEKESKGEDKE